VTPPASDTRKGGRRPGRIRTGVPFALLLPALLGLAFLLLPLVALLIRAPWHSLPEQLTSPEVWQALRLSLVCATSATALSLVIGVPLAWLLARPGLGSDMGTKVPHTPHSDLRNN
jgi:molybdate transport system permease protein